MECERSYSEITKEDLFNLFQGSQKRLNKYFYEGDGRKWLDLYNIKEPIVAALCQGAAMHYHDKKNGVRDFDVWFFYPFNKTHLPYRTIWTWDYNIEKFGRHPDTPDYDGRKVDVIIRSIKNFSKYDSISTIHRYLTMEKTKSANELARKAVVLLYPTLNLGKVVWYRKIL